MSQATEVAPTVEFQRPFPPLSPADRQNLEVNGYVVVENVLSATEVATLRETIFELEADFHADGPVRGRGQSGLPACLNGGEPTPDWDPDRRTHFYSGRNRTFFRIDNLPHVADCFLRYVLHPRILGMAEAAIGGEARYHQSDAHLIRPPENPDEQGYGFHRGASSHLAYTVNGHYHYPFVKALTNLTDLGPDDGGTTVIVGSHKLDDSVVPQTIAAALGAPGRPLVRPVVAPAGSTLLFFESLLHSPGIIRSSNDRLILIGGYCATFGQAWEGYDPDLALRDRVTAAAWRFLDGSLRWQWAPSSHG